MKELLRQRSTPSLGAANTGAASEKTPHDIASVWLTAFNDSVTAVATHQKSSDAVEDILNLFLHDGWWRDKLCLTWNFHSRQGVNQIASFISEDGALAKAGIYDCMIDVSTGMGDPTQTKQPGPDGSLLDIITFVFRFRLTKPAGTGRGVCKLSPNEAGQWKAHVLFTGLKELNGHEENLERPFGHYDAHTRTWQSVHQQEITDAIEDPTVLIVGGAQAGLMTAARLLKLGIRVLVVEKTPRIGDRWRGRYDILTIHVRVLPLCEQSLIRI